MNSIYNADFTKTLPTALKKDEKLKALAQVISEQLQEQARLTDKTVIYTRLDELPEPVLDVIAYDWHCDWYDYDYDVETKRKVIRSNYEVHRSIGTKKAIETALGDIFKSVKVEEWFEYGGEPYTFKVTIDVGNKGMTAQMDSELRKQMEYYKNLRSHCRGIYYKLSEDAAVIKAVAGAGIGTTITVKPLMEKE